MTVSKAVWMKVAEAGVVATIALTLAGILCPNYAPGEIKMSTLADLEGFRRCGVEAPGKGSRSFRLPGELYAYPITPLRRLAIETEAKQLGMAKEVSSDGYVRFSKVRNWLLFRDTHWVAISPKNRVSTGEQRTALF